MIQLGRKQVSSRQNCPGLINLLRKVYNPILTAKDLKFKAKEGSHLRLHLLHTADISSRCSPFFVFP